MAENENGTEGTESSESSGRGLRKLLEDALAKNAELETKLSSLEKTQRAQTLAELFSSHGAKAGAEKFYPQDADTSPDAVKAWIEENAAFVKANDGGNESGGKPPIDPKAVADSQRLNALADGANFRSAGDISDITERIKNAKDKGELDAIYAELGFKQDAR